MIPAATRQGEHDREQQGDRPRQHEREEDPGTRQEDGRRAGHRDRLDQRQDVPEQRAGGGRAIGFVMSAHGGASMGQGVMGGGPAACPAGPVVGCQRCAAAAPSQSSNRISPSRAPSPGRRLVSASLVPK